MTDIAPWKAIIVTGDRYAQSDAIDEAVWRETIFHTLRHHLSGYQHNVLIHGECRGIDLIVEDVAMHDLKSYFNTVLSHPVAPKDWKRYGAKAGPMRNRRMLDTLLTIHESATKEVIAFHNDIWASKGTKNMVEQAIAKGIRVSVYNDEGVCYESYNRA